MPISRLLYYCLILPVLATHVSAQATPGQDGVTLKTETNLVTVRVLIRDNKGASVTGLKKEDFKLLDRGKEQSILTFEEDAGTLPSSPVSNGVRGDLDTVGEASPVAGQPKFVAFYFDDLNSSQSDLMRVRDAAEQFLGDGMKGTDKVAIFSSDNLLMDFTADREAIRAALEKLNGSMHVQQAVKRCPDLSEHQAGEVLRDHDYRNSGAWQLAIAEDNQCHGTYPDPNAVADQGQILRITAMARELASQAAVRTRGNLDQIERVTKYLAKLPGQRTLLLVSPGFLSNSEQDQLDRIIDEALRSQVVISALDPKGLKMTMREMDASRNTIAQNQKTLANTFAMDQAGVVASADALVEFVQSTGGEFFHNDNDLAGGFAALAGHPDTYLLTFSPKDLKKDGKFHELKVSLVTKEKGVTIAARRGYFARQGNETPNSQVASLPVKVTPTSPPTASAPQMDTRIREAMLSSTDATDLPVEVELTQTAGEASFKVHLDARALPFRKEGDHSLDSVTFAAGVFDANDKVGVIKQRSAKLDVPQTQLDGLLANGIDLTFTFPIDAGTHRLRAVVTESEGHKIGSASKSIEMP